MRSRLSLAIVLVTLVALSGCSFLSGSPSNTTSTPTFAGNASAVDFPNGTNRNGITDSRQLVNGHVRAVASSSYAVRATENISIRGNSVTRHRQVTSDLSTDRILLTIDVPDSEDGGERYLDNRTLYARTTVDGETEYSINRTGVPFELFHSRQTLNRPLTLLFEFGRFEGVGTVTRYGRTLIEYRLVAPSLDRRQVQNASVESATGRLLVDQDGIVRFGHIDIQGRESGSPLIVEIEYEVTSRGNVSVTPPDWLARARNTTSSETQSENATG
jgi:hypothetical protein